MFYDTVFYFDFLFSTKLVDAAQNWRKEIANSREHYASKPTHHPKSKPQRAPNLNK